jgi:hypothetical protein
MAPLSPKERGHFPASHSHDGELRDCTAYMSRLSFDTEPEFANGFINGPECADEYFVGLAAGGS